MDRFKRISMFLVTAALLAVAGCASTSDKQGGGSYFDDAAITAKVKKAIYDEPSLKVTDIGVSTDNKVVLLAGAVKSRGDKARAAVVAGKVDGVRRVKNDLQVKQ